MEFLLIVIFLCVLLEYLTLYDTISRCNSNVNSVLLTNWNLVLVYLLAAVILFPLTLLSSVIGRSKWESYLEDSIKNNLLKGVKQ